MGNELEFSMTAPLLSDLDSYGTKERPWPVKLLFGPTRHSAFIFEEFADHIQRETGIDVFQMKERWKADRPMLVRLLNKFRKDRTFADESILDELWQEYLRLDGILTDDEQQVKDECSLAKARTAKKVLRESGLSDAARFGYCKRKSCGNSKLERLLLRGFCPDCRGLEVKQTIASGGLFDAAKPFCLDATKKEAKTSIRVLKNRKNVHPDVSELTTEERRAKVLAAKRENPKATVREIADQTDIPRATVSDILTNPIVKTKPVNSREVRQILRERAEGQVQLKEDARRYLQNRHI